MKPIHVPTREQVSPESQLLFDQLKKRLGKVPNLYATMGYSSTALKGFMDFEATLNKGVFTPKEREAIALVVSEENECNYCLAGHTALALRVGFTKDDTLAIRKGKTADAHLNVIIELAQSMTRNKGKAAPPLIDNFYQAGYQEGSLMELIGLVTLRVYTNYVYAITEIPIDFPAIDSIH